MGWEDHLEQKVPLGSPLPTQDVTPGPGPPLQMTEGQQPGTHPA